MLPNAAQLLKHDLSDSVEWQVAEARAQLRSLEKWLVESAKQGIAAHEVERDLFAGVLRLGFTLFGAFLKLVGPGELGEAATLDDGRLVPRLPEQHTRRLLTVFGSFAISRWVY